MRVSVVIPTFNRGRFLKRAIDSVLAQKDCETEVIVVDDASTDETTDVLAEFDGRVRVIRNDSNLERGASRNAGVTAAQCSHVAFLDSDDHWDPEKLSSQLPSLAGDRASVTGTRWVGEEGDVLACKIPPADASDRLLIRNMYYGAGSSIALPKKVFEKVGGFPEERAVQGVEDWLFLIKLHRLGQPIEIVPECLVNYVIHPAAGTSDVDRVAACMWAGTDWLEEKGYLESDLLRKLRGAVATSIARQYAYRGSINSSMGWLQRARAEAGSICGVGGAFGATVSAAKGLLDRARA